ncbi:MAG: Potassium voltage-gated channel subfamily KQT; possible potassium channel, VIC family, partial [uncultured Microvirga sp.]
LPISALPGAAVRSRRPRSARDRTVPAAALPQARALFLGPGVPGRGRLRGAPRALGDAPHPRRPRPDHGEPDVSGRAQRAAGPARHHPGRHVVGRGHAHDGRLRRRRAGHGAGQGHRLDHGRDGVRHAGAADRHHRDGVLRRHPPAPVRGDLGHDRPGAAFRPSRRRRHRRDHGAARFAHRQGRRSRDPPRRQGRGDVLHRRRRGRGRTPGGGQCAALGRRLFWRDRAPDHRRPPGDGPHHRRDAGARAPVARPRAPDGPHARHGPPHPRGRPGTRPGPHGGRGTDRPSRPPL